MGLCISPVSFANLSGVVGCSIRNAVGNLKFADVRELWSGDLTAGDSRCDSIVDMLVEGLSECIDEQAIEKVTEFIFGDGAANNELFKAGISEPLQNVMSNMQLIKHLREKISTAVCSVDWTEIIGNLQNELGDMGEMLGDYMGDNLPDLGSIGDLIPDLDLGLGSTE